jgi:hypothetical protein
MPSMEDLQSYLVELSELDASVMSAVLKPRAPGNLNDVLLAYYAIPMSEPIDEAQEFLSPVEKLSMALDIVLRNQGVSYEHRQVFITHLRDICQREPELLGHKNPQVSGVRVRDDLETQH